MKIIKNSGDIEDFNPDKLRKSLSKSGADKAAVEEIVTHIRGKLYNGMKTKEIYSIAGKMLKKVSASHAARYNLRAAIQQLGPAGFFFEKFTSLIFNAEGYETKTNLMLQGRCVLHEIDVVVKKMNIVTMVECKFHAGSMAVSDVKVPMYILSRFNDIRQQKHRIFSNTDTIDKCLIVTNNRFTTDAITFGDCSGLKMLSWDYPVENNLKTKIDAGALYPLTCLTSLSMIEKEKVLVLNVILVKQLLNSSDKLVHIGISENRRKIILNEAAGLCNYLVK